MKQHTDCVIVDEEAKHIIQSRRLGPGDALALTNGIGFYASGSIKTVDKQQKTLVVNLSRVEIVDRSRVKRVVASAIPKGDRQAVMLNMITQLGMDEYIPMECEHSVVRYKTKDGTTLA